MKIFLISPNIKTLFSEEQIEVIKQSGDVVFHSKVSSFDSVNGLFEGDEERILAIDPDIVIGKFEMKLYIVFPI